MSGMNKILAMLKRHSELVINVIKVFFSFMSITALSFELWEAYQVPKDRWLYLGIAWFLGLLLVIRKVSYKDYEVWAILLIGFLFKYFYFYKHGYNAENYGVVYSKVLSYRWTVCILFITLMINSLKNRALSYAINKKKSLLLVYTIVVIVTVITYRNAVIPLICPMLALLFTKMDDSEWKNFVNCIAVAMWLSFIYAMGKSFWLHSDVFSSGRYVGGFSSVENIGMFCGIAFISALYFAADRFVQKEKRWYIWAIIIVALAIPFYALCITECRSAMAGVALSGMAVFALVNRKNSIRVMCTRMVTSLAILLIVFFAIFGLGRYLNKQIEEEKISYHDLSYGLRRISSLGDDKYKKGYFGDDSILNLINVFTSGRLLIYAETSQQIEWKGHEFRLEPPHYYATPHNYFISRMIEMGAIPGAIISLWIIFCLIKEAILCAKGNRGVVFPMMWTVCSVIIIASTITQWMSLLPFGIYFLSYPVINMAYDKESDIS